MPGSPFKKPFRGGLTRATPKRPSKVTGRQSNVPRATSPIGTKGRSVKSVRMPGIRVTTKARRGVPMPHVRQGTQTGTPGKPGSRSGSKSW